MKIRIKDIKKTFGEKIAVDIPDFTVSDGVILGLVGNNGAGKTTLFRMILDLIKPNEGEISISGTIPADEEGETTDVCYITSNTEEWKKYTGAYIDSGFLIDYLTPEEYFSFIAKIENIDIETINQRVASYEHFMNGEILGQKKLIRDMSAGNKQKIGIISALLHTPKIVILDEPFNFLDPSSQSIFKRMLKQYQQENNATVLVSSHNINHTVDLCTEIALLESGKIIQHITHVDEEAQKTLNEYFNVY
ncbi:MULTISPECIES: ABC transporter ATP-binding protein [unclassified Bacteroides]|uniref:ABC transporter ATP-binding protein n=1 Tax=unclassified Bacteroides TaxID=2646097 RepID=UPI0004E1EE71|nr:MULTISPECIES: ABC transporter ATP-binding protein [unclassified Bacteroides]